MTTETKKNKKQEPATIKKLCSLTQTQFNIVSKRQKEILLSEQRNVTWIEAMRDIISSYPELSKKK